MPFTTKLRHILASSDCEIIAWSKDGLSFFVFDTQRWVHAASSAPASAAIGGRGVHSSGNALPQVATVCLVYIGRFSAEILDTYSKTTNFASFVRQLNYYGAGRVAAGSWFGGHKWCSRHFSKTQLRRFLPFPSAVFARRGRHLTPAALLACCMTCCFRFPQGDPRSRARQNVLRVQARPLLP